MTAEEIGSRWRRTKRWVLKINLATGTFGSSRQLRPVFLTQQAAIDHMVEILAEMDAGGDNYVRILGGWVNTSFIIEFESVLTDVSVETTDDAEADPTVEKHVESNTLSGRAADRS